MQLGTRTVKRVGLGTNRLENSEGNRAFLREALEMGLDHIDTAHLYASGESEQTIGEALAPFSDELTVATKVGYNGAAPDRLRAEVEQSLESLRTEVIHLLYLHRVDSKVAIEESLGVLAELREEGKVMNVGISEVSIGEISRAQGVVAIAAVQNEFSLSERKHDEVVDFCAVEGIAFVPFFPLRGGGGAVEEIAEAHGATPNQVKIAWLLARADVIAPIPGTLSVEHLRENLEAVELALSDDEIERLNG
ncbi:MAG TPA: aldo/keto reductase [Solirubrobacterales bacterium]|nr:aldo/keto reductase [Solirubrobacterales bacterium]